MRTLLVSLNAKYEHENPAPWYLKAACDARAGACGEVSVLSATINDAPDHVFSRIARFRPDVAALSCYIWNRDLSLRLCADLREAFPRMVLVAGGPEVSHADGADAYLAAGCDFILAGEGEERFPDLIGRLANLAGDPGGLRIPLRSLADAAIAAEQRAAWRTPGAPLPPDLLVSPCVPAYLERLGGRIAYIESSRGCPYRCAYCLSSESAGMTWLPLERVYEDIGALVRAGAKVVKFVDRTFNLSQARTLAVWHHIARYAGSGVTFHFEVAPDLLADEQIDALAAMPAGLVQIEAGVQSVHADTLARIDRRMDVGVAIGRLRRVADRGNVHVHADLIAGLPGEGRQAFLDSFDQLAAAGPHHLQLGFLKLLRGTRLWREAPQWGYRRRMYAPYEVIASDALPVEDMLSLKDLEETVERFRNSGRFLLTLQWLEARASRPSALYAGLAAAQERMDLLGRAVSSESLFRCMKAFLPVFLEALPAGGGALAGRQVDPAVEALELLRLDWVCAHRNPYLPDWLAEGREHRPPETNEVDRAYGGRNGASDDARRMIRNRYHAARAVIGTELRRGIRRLEAPTGNPWHRVLVDTREVHPVLGRPQIVAMPLPDATEGGSGAIASTGCGR